MNGTSAQSIESILSGIIRRHTDNESWSWLTEVSEVAKCGLTPPQLNVIFSSIQRKTNKTVVHVNEHEQQQLSALFPGILLNNWNLQRLCRVWLLMQVNSSDKELYIKMIDSLFRDAEMNELVALYSSLPLLAYPEEWKQRCSEGIRSNIGIVLEAIMHDNPYPATYLDEAAWNQMILKAFFTDKDIDRINGLMERCNRQLAHTLSDYAKERGSAGRPVNPKLWPLIEKFGGQNNS